jgi:CDGSH-type Zn-finger protein
MSEPVIAQKEPFAIDVKEGKSYWWCSCGQSSKQPFCDGSHKDTDFVPEEYKATKDGTVYFCGCKHSSKNALCDGTHAKL